MKISVKPDLLKFLILGGSGLGLALRTVLFATGMDEKGLLISGHWAGVCLWVLTVLVFAALIMLTRPIQGPSEYKEAHPVSFFGGISSIALAIAIAVTTLKEMDTASPMGLANTVLGFGAAASLIALGYCRLSRTKPAVIFHPLLCAYFALRMVSQYQYWSSDPQLQDYVFYLSAYVALMLTSYHQAAFDADFGNHRSLWLMSLGAVYLCCLSLRGPADQLLLLAAGFWAFFNLTNLEVRPRRQRPTLILEDEPQEEV